MATLNDTKILDKAKAPDYLEFEELRQQGIAYLGKLTGKIWTDYNEHDPGITILESLCYALIDLDYRLKLPIEDLFTTDPQKPSISNFYTPAQILGCNPLTILDYRKLLTDVVGVKNAWLEVATDITDICYDKKEYGKEYNHASNDCATFLNGLYHVLLQLEKEADQKKVLEEVKQVLMAHRNLCEDVADISILCMLPIGVCADIELESDANVADVYMSSIQALTSFFSPSPHFYTLPELLDKGKTIDEILEGRPIDLKKSHGFIDTNELETIQLKKEIHLSDVYEVLFQVKGIKTIRNLSLKLCSSGEIIKGWKFNIPKFYIPELSPSCTSMRFSRNGKKIPLDTTAYNALLELSGEKILYESIFPNLNIDIPKGTFRKDLSDYYSIQNDFPEVYGIAKGGLPPNVSPERKSQALQLKAYLLFFDQVLANYLAQLQHLPQLFSMGQLDSESQKTYFFNYLENGSNPDQPDYIPDVDQLWSWYVSPQFKRLVGDAGSTLCDVIQYDDVKAYLSSGDYKQLFQINPSLFNNWQELNEMLGRLQETFSEEDQEPVPQFIMLEEQCWAYFFVIQEEKLVFRSASRFLTQELANMHFQYVMLNAGEPEVWFVFNEGAGKYSLELEVSSVPPDNRLQELWERKDQYYERRNAFLDHLLARFAEKMTDYSLLLWGSLQSDQNQNAQIAAKENFLSNYPELSSGRGKGSNYLLNGWNNTNSSGFEKKVKILTGVNDATNHDLCPFIVTEYQAEFIAELVIENETLFTFPEKFHSEKEASDSIISLLNSLKNSAAYQVLPVPHNDSFGIEIVYQSDHKAIFTHEYPTPIIASLVIERLNRIFSEEIREHDVFVSQYCFRLLLKDASGQPVKKTNDLFFSEADAWAGAIKLIKKINEPEHWAFVNSSNEAKMHFYSNKEHPERKFFLRTDQFKSKPDKTIIDKPDLYTYELMNLNNSFKLIPIAEFESEADAKIHAYEVLFLASLATNFKVREGDLPNRFAVQLFQQGQVIAETFYVYKSKEHAEEAAENIAAFVRSQLYEMEVIKEPYKWKFYYQLGYDPHNNLLFTSEEEYELQKKAMEGLDQFIHHIHTMSVKEDHEKWVLESSNSSISKAVAPKNVDQPVVEKQLALQKAIVSSLQNHKPEVLGTITKDEQTKEGTYVYQVVDKERQIAFYNLDFYGKASILKEKEHFISSMKKPVFFLRICEDGDIISERKHEDGNLWYHYQLKSPQEDPFFILFESVIGYPSPDLAMQAFKKLYIQIIDWGSSALEYGNKISLSLIWKPYNQFPSPSDPVVYIPLESKIMLGGTDVDIIKKLVQLCNSYPYRILDPTTPQFETLFCSAPKNKPLDCSAPIDWVYYYRLIDDNYQGNYWQSVQYYSTISKVKAEFEYFIFLHSYTGNIYIDCYDCDNHKNSYRFFIREVLLESTHRYMDQQSAWGKNGIEKYLCAEQSFPFYGYQRSDDCCYSFVVYCGPPVLIHPCIYDIPETRNKRMQELYRQYQFTQQHHSWQIIKDQGNTFLTNAKGEHFVQVIYSGKNDLLSFILDSKDDFLLGQYKIQGEIDIDILFKEGHLKSLKHHVSKESLLEELRLFFCYYPLIKQANGQYAIEIRLPGFSDCMLETDPCFCDPDEPEPPCWLAWKSSCNYNSLKELEEIYVQISKELLNFKNYLAGFECDCHSFSILLKVTDQIIAHSPQCYKTREAVCEAIQRTHDVTNMEGLHLVEHILLRPHCEEDCVCRDDIRCLRGNRCTYPWNVIDVDPCDPNPVICFTPGEDPYSFIATAILPGWPRRYRDQDKRKIIESIMYEEVPSHILLRILWLAPMDFCLMETQFKKWNRFLAGKKNCQEDFSVCGFLQDLLHKDFECLDPCTECQPCKDKTDIPVDPCQDVLIKDVVNAASFTNQINSIYCWTQMICEGEDIKEYPVDVEFPREIRQKRESFGMNESEIPVKKDIFENRYDRFHSLLKEVKTDQSNEAFIKKAEGFFKLKNPSPKQLISIITRLGIQGSLPGASLSRHELQLIYSAVICTYLDRILITKKDISELKVLEEIVPLVLQQGIDLTEVYQIWNAQEIEMVEEEDKIALVAALLLGK